MSEPTWEEAREISEWRPPLGVLSVYLGFDPADPIKPVDVRFLD